MIYIIAFFIVLYVFSTLIKNKENKNRLNYLRNKYADEDLFQKIFKCRIWQGQTAEQLRDSCGTPYDIEQKVLKTKTKEIWKYKNDPEKSKSLFLGVLDAVIGYKSVNKTRANGYKLQITLDNDIVVGWDDKR